MKTFLSHYPATNLAVCNNNYALKCEKKVELNCIIYVQDPTHFTVNIRLFEEHVANNFELVIEDEKCSQTEKITFTGYSYCETFETKLHLTNLTYENSQLIPKKIHLTSQDLSCKDSMKYNQIMTLRDTNPEYDLYLYDDMRVREFIREHFPYVVLLAYDLLVPGSFQADLFRYCCMYVQGGVYIDDKYLMRTPLRNIILPKDGFIVTAMCERTNNSDPNLAPHCFESAFFMCEAKDIRLLNLINRCVYNITNAQQEFLNDIDNLDHQGDKNILHLTGPTVFTEILSSISSSSNLVCRFKHYHLSKKEENVKNLHNSVISDYEGNLISNISDQYRTLSVHYSELWKKKELFYQPPIYLGKYLIFVYPYQNEDKFNFIYDVENNKLGILRIDKKEGWGLNLRLKIIIEDKVFHLVVGSSSEYSKFISLV